MPRRQLWNLVCETARYADWVVNTIAVVQADAAVAEPGVGYRERNRIAGPWSASSQWRVLEAQAPRRALHEGNGIALAKWMRLELLLEEAGPGATSYTHNFSYEPALGPLGPILDLVLRPSLARDMRATVRKLKTLAEAESA